MEDINAQSMLIPWWFHSRYVIDMSSSRLEQTPFRRRGSVCGRCVPFG